MSPDSVWCSHAIPLTGWMRPLDSLMPEQVAGPWRSHSAGRDQQTRGYTFILATDSSAFCARPQYARVYLKDKGSRGDLTCWPWGCYEYPSNPPKSMQTRPARNYQGQKKRTLLRICLPWQQELIFVIPLFQSCAVFTSLAGAWPAR